MTAVDRPNVWELTHQLTSQAAKPVSPTNPNPGPSKPDLPSSPHPGPSEPTVPQSIPDSPSSPHPGPSEPTASQTKPDPPSSPTPGPTNEPIEIIDDDEEETLKDSELSSRFDWSELDGVKVPCIYRDSVQYVAVRTVDIKFLSRRIKIEELEDSPLLLSGIDRDEATLLTEINCKLCKYEWGKQPFTASDLIVKFLDFKEYYAKLKLTSQGVKGGWLQVNNTVTPFVYRRHKKFVPLRIIRVAAKIVSDDDDVRTVRIIESEVTFIKNLCSKYGARLKIQSSAKLVSLENVRKLQKFERIIDLPADSNPFEAAVFCKEADSSRDDSTSNVTSNSPSCAIPAIEPKSSKPFITTVASPTPSVATSIILPVPSGSSEITTVAPSEGSPVLPTPSSKLPIRNIPHLVNSVVEAMYTQTVTAVPEALYTPTATAVPNSRYPTETTQHGDQSPEPLDLSSSSPHSASSRNTTPLLNTQANVLNGPDVVRQPQQIAHSTIHQGRSTNAQHQQVLNRVQNSVHPWYHMNSQMTLRPYAASNQLSVSQSSNPYSSTYGIQPSAPFQPSLEDLQRLSANSYPPDKSYRAPPPNFTLPRGHRQLPAAAYQAYSHSGMTSSVPPHAIQESSSQSNGWTGYVNSAVQSARMLGARPPTVNSSNNPQARMHNTHAYNRGPAPSMGMPLQPPPPYPRLMSAQSHPHSNNGMAPSSVYGHNRIGQGRPSAPMPSQPSPTAVGNGSMPQYCLPQARMPSATMPGRQNHTAVGNVAVPQISLPPTGNSAYQRLEPFPVSAPISNEVASLTSNHRSTDQVKPGQPAVPAVRGRQTYKQEFTGQVKQSFQGEHMSPATPVLVSSVTRMQAQSGTVTCEPMPLQRVSSSYVSPVHVQDAVSDISSTEANVSSRISPATSRNSNAHVGVTPTTSTSSRVNQVNNELSASQSTPFVDVSASRQNEMAKKYEPRPQSSNDIHVRFIRFLNRTLPVYHSIWRAKKEWFVCVEEVGLTFFPQASFPEIEYALVCKLKIHCVRMTPQEEHALCNYYGIPQGILRSKCMLSLSDFQTAYSHLNSLFEPARPPTVGYSTEDQSIASESVNGMVSAKEKAPSGVVEVDIGNNNLSNKVNKNLVLHDRTVPPIGASTTQDKVSQGVLPMQHRQTNIPAPRTVSAPVINIPTGLAFTQLTGSRKRKPAQPHKVCPKPNEVVERTDAPPTKCIKDVSNVLRSSNVESRAVNPLTSDVSTQGNSKNALNLDDASRKVLRNVESNDVPLKRNDAGINQVIRNCIPISSSPNENQKPQEASVFIVRSPEVMEYDTSSKSIQLVPNEHCTKSTTAEIKDEEDDDTAFCITITDVVSLNAESPRTPRKPMLDQPCTLHEVHDVVFIDDD